VIGSEPTFRACLAAVLRTDVASLPQPDGDPSVFWRQWLAGRNLGLVPVDDPASFAWAGFWIAVAETSDGRRDAVLMFGVPSGVVSDAAGVVEDGGVLVAGAVLAPLDPHLERGLPYGEALQARGTVAAVLIAPEAETSLSRVEEATAVAGHGLVGDRYASARGTFSGAGRGYELTLIEAEALESLAAAGTPVTWEDARRNIVTRGIGLNALVGRLFWVGEVECVGRRLAEPCAHLQRLAPDGILRGLVHRGGLRADIVVGGTIRVGDTVAAVPDPA
jgi:MOSC domain-containing protein